MSTDPSADPFGPHATIISSIYEFSPAALEQLAQWIEQRGIATPIGQIVGYQREQLVASVINSGTQSIPNVTLTTVTFDTVLSDEQKTFNGSTALTLPYNGEYVVSGRFGWANNATGSRMVSIRQTGSAVAQDTRPASVSAADFGSTVAAVIVGKKGDTITRTVYQDSGGALSTLAGECSLELALLNVY